MRAAAVRAAEGMGMEESAGREGLRGEDGGRQVAAAAVAATAKVWEQDLAITPTQQHLLVLHRFTMVVNVAPPPLMAA